MLKRRRRLKKYIRREKSPPLIYFYSAIERVAVDEEWLSLLPEKTR